MSQRQQVNKTELRLLECFIYVCIAIIAAYSAAPLHQLASKTYNAQVLTRESLPKL